ncbi:MAG: FHA domain-containing protein, partial [Planctomycetota bacterium]
MGGQSWLVGAISDCDVVIDAATVSGRHCRLTQTSDGFVLEDLESTNGTYVNGWRIVRPRHVTPADEITLGRTVRLPWARLLSESEETLSVANPIEPGTAGIESRADEKNRADDATSPPRTVRIGRSGDNEVVLDHEGVSDHHARLIIRDEALTIEDLGSEAGTAIGSPGRRISRASVGLDDTVFFAAIPLRVSRLVEAQATKGGEAALRDAGAFGLMEKFHARHGGTWLAITGSGILLLAAILGLGLLFLGDDHDDHVASEQGEHVPPLPATSEPARTDEDRGQSSSARNPQPRGESRQAEDPTASSPSKQRPAEPTSTTAGNWSDALLLVLVGNESGEFYRVGTAWAVAPKTVVSTASVVMTARQLQPRFPKTLLLSPAQNRRIPVVSQRVHPRYEEAAAACDQAEQKLETLRGRMEELPGTQDEVPPRQVDPEQMKDQLVDARLEAMQAAERQVYFDAASMRIAQPVGFCLTLAPSERRNSLRPQMKVRTPGLAFDFKDPFFDPATTPTPSTLEGRIGQLVSYEETTSRIQRLTIQIEGAQMEAPQIDGAQIKGDQVEKPLSRELERGQLEYAYVGSPVLNEQGRVVAMYSRPTPSDQIE